MNKPKTIKICGLSTTDAIDAAVSGGATHIGFIFFEKSPRHVSVETAKNLAAHAGDRIKKVAVSVDADNDYLDQIVAATDPDILQLHGKESRERLQEIKARYNLPVMKAIAIRTQEDLEKAKDYLGVADMFLFDAKPPEGSDLPGGNGVAFDWEIMDHWDKDMPYMLSGGLDAGNVHEALHHSGANAVDVSSGVERVPGQKDLNLIQDFLKTIT
ncbi:MAG: phosphoribosylanthranilate isomerase [Pseudomonadota bacterium]